MNYTIAWIEEPHSGFSVDYGKDGNRYYVSMHDKESDVYRSRKFDNRDEAVKTFLILTDAVCRGLYSFENRVAIMIGGKPE